LDELLDWELIGDKLRRARARSRSDRRGNSGYDPLKEFKAVMPASLFRNKDFTCLSLILSLAYSINIKYL